MVAIITGATGGIGKAICTVLARDGYDIVLLGRDSEALLWFKNQLHRKYPRRSFYLATVSLDQPNEIRAFFLRNDIPLSRVTALINNAGISVGGTIFTESEKDWNKGLAINLSAPFLLTQEVVRLMKKHKRQGSVVNIASIAGLIGAKKPNYSAAKAGLIGLTKATARECGVYGIRVNAIAPGAVDTGLIADWDEKKRQEIMSQTPLRRIAKPEEIAEIVSFLVSPKASFITGAVINATGGQYLG